MEEKKDQVVSDVIEGDDQAGNKQSEETKVETLSVEKLAGLTKDLQKGYTVTRQELSEIKENLNAIVSALNQQSGAAQGDDMYVTESRLRDILQEQSDLQEQSKAQADTYIDSALDQLKAQGIVETEQDANDLMEYALKLHEPDLIKVGTIWKDVKSAKDEGKKEAAKKTAGQQEGSKVGTSSRTPGQESTGVDYQKVRKMDWYNF